jgi:glyoxylase-like metal-dependent hydrolase (beta-lactamase superfamily II)
MKRTTIGNVEVIALVDASAAYPGSGVYPKAGDALKSYTRYLDAEGRVVLNFGCFLLRDGGATVLVDTGWGPEHDGRLLAELDAAGVAANDIGTVIFTHLHGDHTGWNIDRSSGTPVFSNARYLVPRADWDHYHVQDPPSASFTRDVLPLQSSSCVDLIEGTHRLTPAITAIPTPGHTPGHTSIVISSGGEHGCILGDVVISPIDVEDPGMQNGFDWHHGVARTTRLAVLDRLIESGATVGASHLPAPGLGRFVFEGGSRRWRPLAP